MKKITEYKIIIVDFDGTLYYQRPLRVAMLIEMLLHFWKLPDFIIINKYRNLYEKGLNEKERLKILPARTSKIVKEWMINRPLKYIRRYKDEQLIKQLKFCQSKGSKIIVCSDYPIKQKLCALDLRPTFSYDANDMGCLKPDTSGLIRLLPELKTNFSDCLVIGDRYEKDGKLAKALNADYIILPKTVKQRLKFYNLWLHQI